jgi:hypothetical protein
MNEILSKTFERVQTTPIMTHSDVGWDSLNIGGPFIIDDGSQLVMYFLGQTLPYYTCAIGRATGPKIEPPVSWTKYAGNPILTTSDSGWDSGTPNTINGNSIRFGSVVKIGATYYLYYSREISPLPGMIGLATSTDGINFVKYAGNPILTPDMVGEYHCAIPCVINVGGVYYMYYTSSSVNNFWTPNQYRVASSSDGIHFTKLGVILTTSSSGSDSVGVEQCKVYQASDGYMLVYEGFDGVAYSCNVATSSSPAGPFTKFSGNPIFQKSGVPGTFDQYQVATPYFYMMNEKLYLFYQGGDSPTGYLSHWSIGLAAISLGTPDTGVLKVFASYNASYVVTSVTVSGPQTVVGTTTTDLNAPLSFSLTPGSYVVSGTYFSPRSESIEVVEGQTSTVTLNFGGPLPPSVPELHLPLQLIFIVSAFASVAGLVFFARRRSTHYFSINRRGKHRRHL